MSEDSSARELLVRQLVERQAESRSLDFKAPMPWGPSKADKGELLKCIMAFANTRDGGYLLIGVEQNNGRFVPVGVAPSEAESFDPTDIGTFAQNYCSVQPAVTVHTVELDGADLVLLSVAEFGDEPIVCTRDLHKPDGEKLVLRAGSIYVRTPDARCLPIESGEAMRSFLDLAVQKRGDALLHQIRRLVGAPALEEPGASPAPYEAERQAADELFDSEMLVDPYWYVQVWPAEFEAERIATANRARELRREAAVSIRGWDFPHVDRDNDRPFEDGVQSVTHWARFHEAHRIYRSGLFTWRRQLKEDHVEAYGGTLSFLSSIYSLTEFFLFASRFMTLLEPDGDVILKIGVTGLKDRDLQPDRWDIAGLGHKAVAERFDRSHQIPLEELRASHLELAAKDCQDLFALFDADIRLHVIADWQQQFIERRF